jgi:hypothetical protein
MINTTLRSAQRAGPSIAPGAKEGQLGLFETARHAPDSDLAWLENLLAGARCWVTAADIMLTVGCLLNDRDLRALASQSNFIISGQKGYKHIEHSTPEEIHHCAAALESQAKQMAERAGRIRSAAHKLFGP